MIFESKYNIGDTLYFLVDNVVVVKEISEINISLYSYNHNIAIINYGFLRYDKSAMGDNPILYIKEENVFHTKEELLKSL